MSLLLFYDYTHNKIWNKVININLAKNYNETKIIKGFVKNIKINIIYNNIFIINTSSGKWVYLLNIKSDELISIFNHKNLYNQKILDSILLNINNLYKKGKNFDLINKYFIEINKPINIKWILKNYINNRYSIRLDNKDKEISIKKKLTLKLIEEQKNKIYNKKLFYCSIIIFIIWLILIIIIFILR